jgi:biotin synthase-related radical SAM superfamily protein
MELGNDFIVTTYNSAKTIEKLASALRSIHLGIGLGLSDEAIQRAISEVHKSIEPALYAIKVWQNTDRIRRS